MNDSPFLNLVRTRYSVRKYDPERNISDGDLISILEAASLAPSASNRQPWRFIVVKDTKLRETICRDGLGGVVPNRFANRAPVIIVLCVDTSLNYVRLGEFVKGIPYEFIDSGISGEHLVLRAWELGIGSCWIGWFNERRIKRILSIPKAVRVVSLITLGYPEEGSKVPEKKRKDLSSIAFMNRYGDAFETGHKE